MDRSHTVGLCKYKAKYSFFLRQISLIFLRRFCALNFSLPQSTHQDHTFRAEMDLRSIVTYLWMNNMNAREIYADMNGTLGAGCIVSSTVMKYLRETSFSKSMLDTDFEPKIEEGNFVDEAILGALEKCPFSSLRQIAKRIPIPTSMVRYHLVNYLGSQTF
jgi:hypothetical protein